MRNEPLTIIVLFSFLMTFTLSLNSCREGGDVGVVNINANSAPKANTGPDQNVTSGSQVTLDGSGSSGANGDALIYEWSFKSKPEGSTAVLANSSSVNPTFAADKEGVYVVSLSVIWNVNNNLFIASPGDEVTITVTTSNGSSNIAPVANAGPDQNVFTGSVVALDGSGSGDENGDVLGFSWAIASKPEGSLTVLTNSHDVNPTFTADKDGAYVVILLVNDGKVPSSNVDIVTITAATTVPLVHVPDTNQYTQYAAGDDGSYSINSLSYNDNFDGTITGPQKNRVFSLGHGH